MVPGKLDNVMEVSPTMMEKNGKSVKFPEEKMMICTSNCEDNIFDDDATKGLEEKLMMTCENNCQENTFHMEFSPSGHDSTMASKGSDEVVEVNILDNVDQDEERVAETEPRYVTESSSSFGCTEDSRIGSGAVSSDVEVESQVWDTTRSLLGFDGYSDLFRSRKKKLTAHWRKFVRPLLWRCKWVELQIRELHSQACKYDRELSGCEKSKQSQLEKCATKDLGMKSVPFISQNRSVKLMKRKKRKQVEETVDIPSYMSCHSLFSYYGVTCFNLRNDFSLCCFWRGVHLIQQLFFQQVGDLLLTLSIWMMTMIILMEHEILIHNQPVKEELNNIEEVGNQGIAESQLATKGKAGNVQHVPDSNCGKMPVNREQSDCQNTVHFQVD